MGLSLLAPADEAPAESAVSTEAATPAPVDPATTSDAPAPAPAPASASADAIGFVEVPESEPFVEPATPVPAPPPPAPSAEPAVGTSWGPEDMAPPRPPVVVRTDDGYALVAIGNPQPMPPIPPELTIRKWKRSAGVLVGVSAATYLGAVALQGVRMAGMAACEDADSPDVALHCQRDMGASDPGLGMYTVMFHSMSVAAAGGAGAMLGRARATEDVQIHRHWTPKPLATGLGLALAIGNGLVYVTSGLALLRRQQVADDPASVQRRRFLVLDATAIMTSVGAGLAGYGIAYGKHAKVLSKIHLGAALGPDFSGLSASGRF